MASKGLTVIRPWRKSRRSDVDGTDTGQCAEVTVGALGGQLRICTRDSKHPDGAILDFGSGAWKRFIDTIKAGGYDRTA